MEVVEMAGRFNKGTMVEYNWGSVIEDVKVMDEYRYSFDWRGGHTKWCAIGIITKVEYGTTGWLYLVRVLWNNCKKEEGFYYIGASDRNLRELKPEEVEQWNKTIGPY